MWFNPFRQSEETQSYKSLFTIFGVALLIFSIGYTLRPIVEIVDEFHDSDDEGHQ